MHPMTATSEDYKAVDQFVDRFHDESECKETGTVTIQNGIIQVIAASPSHSVMKCVLDWIQEEMMDWTHHHEGYYGDSHTFQASPFDALLNLLIMTNALTPNNLNEGSHLVTLVTLKTCPKLDLSKFYNDNDFRTEAIGKLSYLNDINVTIAIPQESIKKGGPSKLPIQFTNKTTMDDKISQHSWFCHDTWLWPCHRCLNSGIQGTYAKCQWLCGSCFDIMYSQEEADHNSDFHEGDNQLKISVHVQGLKERYTTYLNKNLGDEIREMSQKLIPKVIHQTWSENISILNYPQLYRLQNSWRVVSSDSRDWTYKFYSDDDVRQYIIQNFPQIFLEAYDTLIPGAYKADLFRYLVLMKEGGVYADIDVKLDSSLDEFITPTMTFFAPRDAVGECANGQFCLWNGLVGVSPGHPIIVRAVERLINLILRRADLLDIEHDVASYPGGSGINTEAWKVRAVPPVVLSGPCALGIAVNEIFGNDPLTRFDVGWLDHEVKAEDFGDMMILAADKTDLGAMRFTDVERNLMLASTDMAGLSKARLDTTLSTENLGKRGNTRVKTKEKDRHYSLTGSGMWLWGAKGVYKDDLVSDRSIKLSVDLN